MKMIYFVKYFYERFRNAPLVTGFEHFDTMAEAVAWANAPHPELPRFYVCAIIPQGADLRIKVHPCDSRPSVDHSTDACILGLQH
jgi:hypothetical protein